MPECVATTLIEDMVKNAKDPEYTESIVKWALGSMYTGKVTASWSLVRAADSTNTIKGGADTVSYRKLAPTYRLLTRADCVCFGNLFPSYGPSS